MRVPFTAIAPGPSMHARDSNWDHAIESPIKMSLLLRRQAAASRPLYLCRAQLSGWKRYLHEGHVPEVPKSGHAENDLHLHILGKTGLWPPVKCKQGVILVYT